MSHEIVVRDLTAADVEAAVEIALSAWAPIYAACREIQGDEVFAALHPDWRAEKAEQIRKAVEPGPQRGFLVAELDGRVVGFVTFYGLKPARVGEIGNNAVHPAFHNRGIAQRLYERAFERMREMGIRCVQVSTGAEASHAPARRAYEKAGFDRSFPHVTYYRMV